MEAGGEQAGAAQETERRGADVDLQQVAEEMGLALEQGERAGEQPG